MDVMDASLDLGMRLHAIEYGGLRNGSEFLFDYLFLLSQIVFVLNSKPKIRGVAEVSRQPQRSIGGDASISFDDLRYTGCRHAGILGEAVRGDSHRNKKLFEKDLTRSYVRNAFHHSPPLMVINDLNIGGNPSSPVETDPPLAVYSNAILTLSIPGKCLEHVSRRYSQVRQIFRPVNDNELTVRQALNFLRESLDEFSPPDSLSVLVRKRLDHTRNINAGRQ